MRKECHITVQGFARNERKGCIQKGTQRKNVDEVLLGNVVEGNGMNDDRENGTSTQDLYKMIEGVFAAQKMEMEKQKEEKREKKEEERRELERQNEEKRRRKDKKTGN